MAGQFQMGDYVDVAARIVEFRDKHPEGSLQPADPGVPYRIETIGEQTYIAVVAAAYRTPNDPRPGIGMAYEQFPGRTPYTKGSELQNAETSAWGRAIVAALAADTKRGVASADEVRNRQAERDLPDEPPSPAALRSSIRAVGERLGMDLTEIADEFLARAKVDIRSADASLLAAHLKHLRQREADQGKVLSG
ncbi:MAG TPA: hypothetical protein VF053_02525 [Streptosporangiales bacterium]